MSVVSLAVARREREPHLSGVAACLACRHSWVVVAPVGTHQFECPQCNANKGYLVNSLRHAGETFVCDCGSDVFRISREGPYCVNCGTPAVGWFD